MPTFGMPQTLWNIPGEEEFAPAATGAVNTQNVAGARTDSLSSLAAATRRDGPSSQGGISTLSPTGQRSKLQPIASKTTGWVAGLNDPGVKNAVANEGAFWRSYGNLNQSQPWGPGSNLAAYMQETYQPRALSLAANPYMKQGESGFADTLKQMGGAADSILGGGMGKGVQLDPSAIVGNVMMALSGANSLEDIMKLNPELAIIFNGTQSNPGMQVEALLGFLSDALAGAMPPDMLNSWIATLRRIGDEFAFKMDTTGNSKNFNIANWAKELVGRLGPTLGL